MVFRGRFGPIAIIAFLGFLCANLGADPVSFAAQGRESQNREDWYSAIEFYQEAIRENPSYVIAYQGMAECFYALGEYDKALAEVDKAIALKKTDTSLADLRGFILIGLGRLDESRTAFEAVLRSVPNDLDARFGLGEIEVASGRLGAANSQYEEALRRNPMNRKALLSLALLSREAGNQKLAREYADKALRYYSDDPQAYYISAWLSAAAGNDGEAEKAARSALAIKPNYDDALSLLATVLYGKNRLTEVIQICDARIADNRNAAGSWYLRALCLEGLGKVQEALSSALTGLGIDPNDEILRALYERILLAHYDLESPLRAPAAAWHSKKAAEFETKNLSDQGIFEYRRALTLNPYNAETRFAYAKLLLTRGYPAAYLAQLEFIQSQGKGSTPINDSVEAYRKLLASSAAVKWGIDPLYLNRDSVRIGLYWTGSGIPALHADATGLTAAMIADAFVSESRFSVTEAKNPVSSYSEAFRLSRTSGEDYFALVSFAEGEREIQINVDMYVSATGSPAKKFSVYRTGNDRYANALRRLVRTVADSMPIRGKLLKRYQGEGVINLGKIDGVAAGASFDILSVPSVRFAEEGLSLKYDQAGVLGTFTVTNVEGEISQGSIARLGFFDRVNEGDVVVLKPKDANNETAAAEAPQARPPLLDLLRQIR